MTVRFFIKGIIFLLASANLGAQERVVYGKLTAFNRYPVQNIEVVAKKSKAVANSDSLGFFSLVCLQEDVLKIKSKVFISVSMKIEPDTDSLFINLIFVDSPKNRELSNGYGYIKETDLVYAMSHSQQESNDFASYSDIFDLIRGQFPGVTVVNDEVILRSSGSITMGSEALYVVDGIVTNDISWIRPSDVKAIDIIKDAQASLYGSRGGNGVVVIELKKGGD